VVIHHTNRNGAARGSSDFKPAIDQAFLVSNHGRTGGRLLDRITLRYEKSRYGRSGSIGYRYAGGAMQRADDVGTEKAPEEQLRDLLRADPGILKGRFETKAVQNRFKRGEARTFVKKGAAEGWIKVDVEGRQRRLFLFEGRLKQSAEDAVSD